MAYKLSERTMQNRSRNRRLAMAMQAADSVDLGDIATIFIFFGIIGLLTSWLYSGEKGQSISGTMQPRLIALNGGKPPEFGPIHVSSNNESYQVQIVASGIPNQGWSFVQGEVLNAQKQYLFSFGDELWHESGYDDGPWDEQHNSFDINVDFPQPGTYYLRLKFESKGSSHPSSVTVRIIRKRGSYIPHLWFGLITLIIGIILNEVKNRSIINFIERLE